jgi:hypothetical protein
MTTTIESVVWPTRQINLRAAFEARDLRTFLAEVFPDEWQPVAARIVESGATFGPTDKFAPRWSPIPPTVRRGATDEETWLKSTIFRVHDCLHQLWGLPKPRLFGVDDDAKIGVADAERYYFKRVWMCTEVAVLTITEFFYCQWLYDTQPALRPLLTKRNTLLFKRTSPLHAKTLRETAGRLDELLHKRTRPSWVRNNVYAVRFVEDYVPMLAQDRTNIDHNWALLCAQHARGEVGYLDDLPNQRYGRELDGRELTEWLVDDFAHLLNTDAGIDQSLARFNAQRRANVNLPDTWNYPPTPPQEQQ